MTKQTFALYPVASAQFVTVNMIYIQVPVLCPIVYLLYLSLQIAMC